MPAMGKLRGEPLTVADLIDFLGSSDPDSRVHLVITHNDHQASECQLRTVTVIDNDKFVMLSGVE